MKNYAAWAYITFALSTLPVSCTHTRSTTPNYADHSYEELQDAFHKENAWGLHTIIDIKNCNKTTISSPRALKTFVIWLCDLIEMVRFGDPLIVKFGNGKFEGWTLIQLIETSNINAHFNDVDGSGYIDIFSCKLYDPHAVVAFIKEYFDGDDDCDVRVLLRI